MKRYTVEVRSTRWTIRVDGPAAVAALSWLIGYSRFSQPEDIAVYGPDGTRVTYKDALLDMGPDHETPRMHYKSITIQYGRG